MLSGMLRKPRLKVAFTDEVYGLVGDGLILRALRHAFDLEESDQPEVVFYGEHKDAAYRRFKQAKRVYVAVENRYPDFSQCDFAMTFLHLEDERHLRMPLYVFNSDPALMLRDKNYAERVMAEKRGFCSFLVSNGSKRRTKHRIQFFQALNSRLQVASGGAVLNNLGHKVEDKLAFLPQYRFHIAFENESFPGYTTEKIAHPMMCGSIPIYWGNPDIEEEFNPRSFINAGQFSTMEDTVNHVLKVQQDEALQYQYLSEPCFHDNQPNCYYNIERLAAFLVRIADAPMPKRPRIHLASRWFDLKRKAAVYFK